MNLVRNTNNFKKSNKYTGIINQLIHLMFVYAAAAAAAKSLQSYPTLCDPIDGSPPGSPVPGIFQAKVPQWGATAFSCSART